MKIMLQPALILERMADGQKFARRQAAADGTVLPFSEDGSAAMVLHQPQSVGELRQALNQAFGQ